MVNMRAGWCSAPKDRFPGEVIFYLGDEVSAQDPEGQVRHGRITEVNPDEVVVDFNHMLAGKTLNFPLQWAKSEMLPKKKLPTATFMALAAITTTKVWRQKQNQCIDAKPAAMWRRVGWANVPAVTVGTRSRKKCWLPNRKKHEDVDPKDHVRRGRHNGLPKSTLRTPDAFL